MRGARNAEIMTNSNGQLCAISLGADYVSEHEWGVKDTYRSFGVASDKIGIDPVGHTSRVITRVPEDRLVLKDFKIAKRPKSNYSVGWKGTLLMLSRSSYNFDPATVTPTELREMYDSVGKDNDQEPLSTAWSDGDFAIFAREAGAVQFLKDLHAAMLTNDVMIWLGGGGVFQNAGLCFGIVSRMDQSILDTFHEVDTDRNALTKADEATGIKQRLAAASEAGAGRDSWSKPFRYYALSPKWAKGFGSTKNGEIVTAHDVVYWLNPMDQDRVNAGWYTVEQLDAWIAGNGPMVKRQKTEAAV